MAWLDKLERRAGKLAIPNLTVIVIVGQLLVFLASFVDEKLFMLTMLQPALVMQGEVWRLLTFAFTPPSLSPIGLLFTLYVFYIVGTTLESQWGAFRYTAYLFFSWAFTLIAAFAFPGDVATAAFFEGSVFLAFAFVFPEMEFLLFFLLPVKVKWLGALAWLGYAYTFVVGQGPQRALVAAAVAPFFLFFGSELVARMRNGGGRAARRRKFAAQKRATEPSNGVVHRCAECGITDITHPQMQFRYCDECDGHFGFCEAHARAHEHRKAGSE